MERNIVIGVDLGRIVDRSALTVLESYVEVRELVFPTREEVVEHWQVQELHKWPHLTAYSTVVADVSVMMQTSGLEGAILAIDATGIGRAIYELFYNAWRHDLLGELRPIPYVVVGNGESTFRTKYRRVVKEDLVGKLIVALENQLLAIPSGLAYAADLELELANFRRTIKKKGAASYAADGTREHDDLVSSLLLSMWRHNPYVEPRKVAAPALVVPAA